MMIKIQYVFQSKTLLLLLVMWATFPHQMTLCITFEDHSNVLPFFPSQFSLKRLLENVFKKANNF